MEGVDQARLFERPPRLWYIWVPTLVTFHLAFPYSRKLSEAYLGWIGIIKDLGQYYLQMELNFWRGTSGAFARRIRLKPRGPNIYQGRLSYLRRHWVPWALQLRLRQEFTWHLNPNQANHMS